MAANAHSLNLDTVSREHHICLADHGLTSVVPLCVHLLLTVFSHWFSLDIGNTYKAVKSCLLLITW